MSFINDFYSDFSARWNMSSEFNFSKISFANCLNDQLQENIEIQQEAQTLLNRYLPICGSFGSLRILLDCIRVDNDEDDVGAADDAIG